MFTDTESVTYKNETEKEYENFYNNKDKHHFSNYSTGWQFYDDINKMVIAKTKDVDEGTPIIEFVGLKSKSIHT